MLAFKGNKDYDNEFVDRENRPVPIKGHKHTKYFKWGTEWIVPTDNSKDRDIDNSLCSSSVKDPTVEPPIVECVGNYEDSENCGKLNSSVSDSWASCIEVGTQCDGVTALISCSFILTFQIGNGL